MKKLNQYTHTRFNRLKKLLEEYPASQDAEILHQIRVGIKQLKAVANVIGHGDKKFKTHRWYVPLRTIFRMAGEIREPEVLVNLLIKYQIGGLSIDDLSARSVGLAAQFKTQIPSFIETLEKEQKNLIQALKKLDKKDMQAYVKKLEKKVKSKLFTHPDRSQIHYVRKMIKELIYLSDSVHSLKKKVQIFFEKMESLIGDWHDKQQLLAFLKSKTRLTDLVVKKSLILESRRDLKSILTKASEFYSDH